MIDCRRVNKSLEKTKHKFNFISQKHIPKCEDRQGQVNRVIFNSKRFSLEDVQASNFKQKQSTMDIELRVEEFFKQKQKKEKKDLQNCQKSLIGFYLTQQKMSESILKSQKEDLKIMMRNELTKNSTLHLRIKDNKELSNAEMRKLLSKLSQNDFQSYLLEKDKRENKKSKEEEQMLKFLNSNKLKEIKENRKLSYEQLQSLLKQAITKKVLADKERQIFNELNKIKNNTSQKILKQVTVQNLYQSKENLKKEIFEIENTRNKPRAKKQKIKQKVQTNPLLKDFLDREKYQRQFKIQQIINKLEFFKY